MKNKELDLIMNLNNRISQLTNSLEGLIRIVETNNKGLRLLKNIVSANEIALNNIEKMIKDNNEIKFKYKN